MEIEVQKMSGTPNAKPEISAELQNEQVRMEQQRKTIRQNEKEKQFALAKENKRRAISKAETDQYLKDVLQIPSFLNRELKYSVNKELNQVVVKVVDGETDKVIRVIPSETLLKLHSRMKEVIGLIFDQEI